MVKLITSCTGAKYDFSSSKLTDSINQLAKDLNIQASTIKTVTQVHGDSICIVNDASQITANEQADCIITKLVDVCIGIKTADCIPLVIFDPIKQVVAVIHLGRKSILLNLLEKTITTLMSNYLSQPNSLEIYIYPSLQKLNHIVPTSEADKFPAAYVQYLPEGTNLFNNSKLFWKHLSENNLQLSDLANTSSAFVDIQSLVKDKLLALGVLKDNIFEDSTDTYEDKAYHSYRRDYPNQELMLSYAILT